MQKTVFWKNVCCVAAVCGLLGTSAFAQTGQAVRPIPPPGIAVPDADRAELEAGVKALGQEINSLHDALKRKPELLALLPDVQIYYNAVRYALTYNEFYNAREIPTAKRFLEQGMERAKQLREGKPTWNSQTGLVVRGYVSKIDGSVQPYGLVIPASYDFNGSKPHRLDFWFHGRGETLSELSFIDGRQKSPGEFTPPDTLVLHLYGRYCNANRFAGEVDLFEAWENAKTHYRIDPNRIAVRGFSMGGAACWLFATHYSGLWAAAAPGAGFSETADFTKAYTSPDIKPLWWEEKLWHLYDSTDYARNLFNCPTVAYSGEIDGQRQAAVMMEKALAAEGMTLVHIIGPMTAHKYENGAKVEINRRMDEIMAKGRDPFPKEVHFTTWTLKYDTMRWLTVDGLAKHWERARVDAIADAKAGIALKTENVTSLTLNLPNEARSYFSDGKAEVTLDGTKFAFDLTNPENILKSQGTTTYTKSFRKINGNWRDKFALSRVARLVKQHNLQGPIDDAFMGRFIFVTPTGKAYSDTAGAWVKTEQERAIREWRKQFRGEALVKKDTEITEEDIRTANLILWGDPASNKVLARVAPRLPIKWNAKDSVVMVTGSDFSAPADSTVPVFIYPNPLSTKHYIVVNSGFTFREADYLSNARQTPKLPDYVFVNITVPGFYRAPGSVVKAGFFGESWEFQKDDGK